MDRSKPVKVDALAPSRRMAGTCSVCRGTLQLTKEGAIFQHGPVSRRCTGSLKPPADISSRTEPSNSGTITNPSTVQDKSSTMRKEINHCPQDLFSAPVRTVRFLSRAIVPAAAASFAEILQCVTANPHIETHWWTLLQWLSRIIENPEIRKAGRKERNAALNAQLKSSTPWPVTQIGNTPLMY